MSMGPIRLNPGATDLISFAVLVNAKPESPCPDIDDFVLAADIPVHSHLNDFYCDLIVVNNREVLSSSSFSVFPNPATDQLNFQLSENESFHSIRLYRIDGKLVRKKENLLSNSVVLSRNELPCLLYTSPSPRDKRQSRMPSSA